MHWLTLINQNNIQKQNDDSSNVGGKHIKNNMKTVQTVCYPRLPARKFKAYLELGYLLQGCIRLVSD
jgi:hypothetical protein